MTGLLAAFFWFDQAAAQEVPAGRSIIGNGGADELSNDQYYMLGTVGQITSDPPGMDSSTYNHQAGFWYLPGVNVGSPVPIYLQSFSAARQGDVVVLRWQISFVTENAGFHVWRQELGQERIQVTHDPLFADSVYEYVDTSPPVGEIEYWLQEIGQGGEAYWLGPASLPALPLSYRLEPSSPNPCNPQTTIKFTIPVPTPVKLAIYDIRGKLVRTIIDETRPAGIYSVTWNGCDENGAAVASGVYFARLESHQGTKTQKMALAR